MQTRGAAFQLGHLIARSSPTRQPRHAAQPPFPHLQLYDILPWPCRSTSSCSALNLFLVSCFSCYLSPHYKDTLYISLKGFPYSLICFLAFSIKADCCIQDFFYLEPFFFFLHSILSRIFCLCVSFIYTHNLCIPNLTICLRFLCFVYCHLSFLLSSHPHCTFFLKYLHLSTSVSQSQSCSSPTFPEEVIYKDYRVFFHTNISATVRLHQVFLHGGKYPFVCSLSHIKQYIADRYGYY